MINRMIISITRIATAISQVGQYPIILMKVPETIGPTVNPDIKKTEMVEMVRDLYSGPTVSATVAKPTIHAALPAIAWMTRPRKSIGTYGIEIDVSCFTTSEVRRHDSIRDVAAATIIVPAISPPKESRRGPFRDSTRSAQAPTIGPDRKHANA